MRFLGFALELARLAFATSFLGVDLAAAFLPPVTCLEEAVLLARFLGEAGLLAVEALARRTRVAEDFAGDELEVDFEAVVGDLARLAPRDLLERLAAPFLLDELAFFLDAGADFDLALVREALATAATKSSLSMELLPAIPRRLAIFAKSDFV